MNCDGASRVFQYVDGELPDEAREAMDAHLAGCASCRRLVEQEEAFRRAYVARLRPDPAPPLLRDKVSRLLGELARERAPRRSRWQAPWVFAAAALVLLTVGVGLGMNVMSMLERRTMLTQLTEASVEQHQKLARGLLPADITDVSPRAAEDWFRRRLDFNVSLPDPRNPHVTLVGARISHLANAEVAALEYRFDGSPVSLFVIPEEAYLRLGLSEKPTFKMLSHRGYDVIIWRHHGTGYAVVSEIGTRSCQVCHAPTDRLDSLLESFGPEGTTVSTRRGES